MRKNSPVGTREQVRSWMACIQFHNLYEQIDRMEIPQTDKQVRLQQLRQATKAIGWTSAEAAGTEAVWRRWQELREKLTEVLTAPS